MTSHTARLRLNYSTRQLFDLVADVESYPQFMPWVIAAKISRRRDRTIWVEMTIGTRPLRKRFSTVGVLNPPSRIDVSSDDPLFERFKQKWTFEPTPEGSTIVGYNVDFRFRSRSLQLLMGGMFADQIDRTAAAFRRRAQQLFGPSAKSIQNAGVADRPCMQTGAIAHFVQRPDGIASGLSRGAAPSA